MTWTLDFTIKTTRRILSLQHAVSATRWGIEDLGEGSRRFFCGPVEVSVDRSRG